MSIKRSLQSSILLMSILPVLVMAVSAYIIATTKYEDIAKENCMYIAEDFSNGLLAQLNTQIIQSQALASTNDIKSLLLEKVNSEDHLIDSSSTTFNSVQDSLVQLSNNLGNDVDFFVYDVDGYLITGSSTNSVSDWAEVMPESLNMYSETTIIPNSHFTDSSLDIVSPIVVKGKFVGIIRSNVSIDYLSAFMANGDNFIIDDQDNILFGTELTSEDDLEFMEFYANSKKGKATIRDKGTFFNNQNYMYGYCVIPSYNWTYVCKQDKSNYHVIVAKLPIILVIILVMVTIFAILLSTNLAEKYTYPIVELSANMQMAADGDLTVQCDINSENEFGLLSTNFNYMIDMISSNYNQLADAQNALRLSQEELQSNYEHMERLAYTDALTGLYNRMAFFKFAPEVLSNKSGKLATHAVIFIDLDGFKGINDSLGHDYGDLLLQAVSNKLTSIISKGDILARNGGDEFVILRNEVLSKDDLESFLKTLVNIANEAFILDDETVHITLSVGAAIFPQNGLSLNELMKNADIAMYTSKTSGKNGYTFFNSSMEDEVNRRNDLLEILRDSVKNKDVHLLYQPQANISTGEIIGCESLMRLDSGLIGSVSPNEFIPVAEESGLIDMLGEWALLEACTFNQKLIDSGFKPTKVSVNVSTKQLHGDRLIRVIESLPETTGMDLQYLEIELTESVLMTNFDHNLSLIRRMKDLGIQIALDDFGTGYSSFSYLTQIPIDTLKIDKSFIADICTDEHASYISETIINLAHKLGITVVAEGVETIDQLKILQAQSCDILQGYFFSKPISEKEFEELLTINSTD